MKLDRPRFKFQLDRELKFGFDNYLTSLSHANLAGLMLWSLNMLIRMNAERVG